MRRRDGWTPQEDAALRTFWPDLRMSRPSIARALGRSVEACYARARVLGLPARTNAVRVPRVPGLRCPECGTHVRTERLKEMDDDQLLRVRDAVEVELRGRGA